MSMFLRYTGEFYDLPGTVWRCEILQEADSAFLEVGELDFPATGQLQIEYPVTDLEKPVCSSTAKLTVISPGDRTYLDLYSIKPRQIRLDVYRANSLFWSGTLDPEFYEEPYEKGKDYDVSLTFSDFGVLDRIPYDLSGRRTLRDILETALSRSGINLSGIDESLVSTEFEDGTPMTLGSLSIPSENFFDEDGEAASYMDALTGILQPLSLRAIQRAGVVWIYDINALHEALGGRQARRIVWDGERSSLGTNKVYNNIRVTFSPYQSKGSLSPFEYGDTHGPEWTNLTSQAGEAKYNGGEIPSGKVAPECYSYYPDYDESHRHGSDWDYNLVDFTIFLSSDASKCPGLDSIGAGNKFFKIQPNMGGSESSGVAEGFYTGGHGSLESGYPVLKGLSPSTHGVTSALTTKKVYFPALSEDDQADNYLKILVDLLVDPRYNPFEQEGDSNEGKNYSDVKKYGGIALVPVSVVMRDGNGSALCHWSNRSIVENGHPADSIASTRGAWEQGEASWGDAWLAWYDASDPVGGCGLLGWKKNRQCFGVPVWLLMILAYNDGGTLKPWWSFDSFLKAPDGQFIPYPPTGGYLEVRVYNGVWIFTPGDGFSSDLSRSSFFGKGLYGKLRWQLLGIPEVTVAKRSLTFDEVDPEDIEYSGVINRDAKEDLEISTICGTAAEALPTSMGNYVKTDTGLMVSRMSRAGRIDQVEHLLIGTLYSQYADRRSVLRGSVTLDPRGLALYKDDNQDPDTVFLIMGETMDIQSGCSEATFVESRPDEYDGEAEQ